MAGPSTASSDGRHSGWRIAQIVLAVALGVLVLGYCLALLFVGVFAGASVQWDPNDATDLERWTTALAHAAESMRRRAIEAALVMAALAVVAVLAAVRRNRIWLTFGVASGGMLLATVITFCLATEDTLSSLVKQTHERIGPVHLMPDKGELGVEPFTDGMQDAAVEPFTSGDAEREIRVLVESALAEPNGPATTSERMSEPSIEFDAAHPPIDSQSCAPAQAEALGEQLTIAFTIPSDEDGRAKQRVLASWAEAGYVEAIENGRRDESVVRKNSDSAMYAVTVNDRFTVDGSLAIWLESRCL